jgi:Sec-independent protein secretion pathway component TatC
MVIIPNQRQRDLDHDPVNPLVQYRESEAHSPLTTLVPIRRLRTEGCHWILVQFGIRFNWPLVYALITVCTRLSLSHLTQIYKTDIIFVVFTFTLTISP